MFASAIRLNLSNHSFGSSVSVLPNSPGFTKLPSLGAYPPPPIFIPVKAFTNAATFGSNPPGLMLPPPPGGPPGPPGGPPGFPPGFPPPKPPPNPPPNPGGRFWVLLNPNPWLCGGLYPPVFLYKLLKKLNPPVLFPGFSVLLPPWVAPVVVPTGVVVVFNIYGSVVTLLTGT